MFPRPYCIHSEGALDKSIYLLQPGKSVEEHATGGALISESVCALLLYLMTNKYIILLEY